MNPPTVSVVIASYNYGRFIADALQSVRAQSWADWEAIIVDDGSDDDSLHRIDAFLSDGRFRLIRQQHLGQPRTKNCGIVASRGQFIAFLDADDRWKPSKLERQLAVFREQPNVGLCYTRRTLIDESGRPFGDDRRAFPRGKVVNQLFRDNFVCFSSAMLRRELVDKVGMFDEELALAIDYDWWLRVSRCYDFDYVDEALTDYRTGHANLSKRVAERLETALAIMQRFQNVYDRPQQLSPAIARQSFAETYRHRGLVGRNEPGRGIRWLCRSLALRPGDPLTWKALAAACTPATLRRCWRHLHGINDWESLAIRARSASKV